MESKGVQIKRNNNNNFVLKKRKNINKGDKVYVGSSSEYMRSSYMTWRADIGCRVGDVAAPVALLWN